MIERTASLDPLINAFSSIPFIAVDTASFTVRPAFLNSSAAAANLGFSLIDAINYVPEGTRTEKKRLRKKKLAFE